MQLGFINFNTEEKKRVAKMMQLLQESEAIEELGIGRVRDHFSNTLFPGTSTLQHHAKYFVLLPSLYYNAAFKSKRFQTLDEVNRYIKEAEIQITRQLAEKADGSFRTDVTGITGISTYKDALADYRKYVKYDPAYIYGSGLVRYGIIPDTGIERLIFELNNKNQYKSDETEDASELSGDKQVIKTCGETYDFLGGRTMDMSLSEHEASFLKGCITEKCKETLLAFLIENAEDIPKQREYFGMDDLLCGLSPDILNVYKKSVLFSKLIHLIDWRFNYTYYVSFDNADEAENCDEEYDLLFAEYKDAIENRSAYESLFDYIYSIDPLLTEFCEKCYECIISNDKQQVDQLVKIRERTVKRERSKIGNSAYREKGRGKPTPNIFRWETVKTMVNEIRNPK